ncbi:MAG: urea transporter, permease protein UrtB [Acidimicrobiales bacterium]|nr:urea transporter, permease protein UrtB [Acidimicrobiales bacterium]
MNDILGQLFNGLSLASVLLLAGVGLTFTFGQMGVINMAHGEFMMAGAYTPYVLQTGLLAGTTGLAFAVSIPLAFVVAGILGLVLEATLLRRMYGRALDSLLVTVGVSLVLQQAARDLFGAPNVEVRTPTWLRGSYQLLDVVMPRSRLFMIALVAVVIAAISVWMATSPQGRRMRAVMQNRDLAEVSGINSRRVDRTTFFLGSGLAGVAGVAVSLIGSIGSQMGTGYIIDAFLVVVVGGLGKLRGTVLAAVALGLLNSFSEFYSSASIGKAILLVCVIGFLQFRPNGLVSFRTRGLTA